MASRVANALIASGVRTQERIAYLSKNDDHFLPFLLGACKARAALAPFNFRLAAPEIARLIEDSGARIMFVGPDVVDLADRAVALLASKPRMIALGFDREGYERLDAWMEAASRDDPGSRRTRRTTSIQLYTSGTTGASQRGSADQPQLPHGLRARVPSGGLNYRTRRHGAGGDAVLPRRRRQCRADRDGERRALGDPAETPRRSSFST